MKYITLLYIICRVYVIRTWLRNCLDLGTKWYGLGYEVVGVLVARFHAKLVLSFGYEMVCLELE